MSKTLKSVQVPKSTNIISFDCIQEETIHTKLAGHYIDEVLRLLKDGNALQRLKVAREKLLSFLEASQYYHAPVLLSKVHETELYRECALLYGRVSKLAHNYKLHYNIIKMEEHEKALTLLTHKLKDFKQAEEYCCLYSQVRVFIYKQQLSWIKCLFP